MNPHQKNKIDVNSLSPEEQRLFRLYGKLPSRSDRLSKHLKERKYFDSGDYALSKAGKANSVDTGSVGSQHPLPENIPHLSSPVSGGGVGGVSTGVGGMGIGPGGAASSGLLSAHLQKGMAASGATAGSPVKESSFLHRGTSADEIDDEGNEAGQKDDGEDQAEGAEKQELAGAKEGIPIRR